MRHILSWIALALCLGSAVQAADQVVNLAGTWVIDQGKSESDSPKVPSGRPRGVIGGGGYPGGGYPGGGYPGGGYPGGGYPGGGYPGGGYPGGGYPGGGYPGGGYPGGTYPGGNYPGGTYPGGGYPGGTYPGGNYPGGYPGGGAGGGTSAGRAPHITDLTLTISQTESAIRITRRFKSDDEEQQVEQTFSLDGGQNSNPDSSGRGKYLSKSSLGKDKLVNLGMLSLPLPEGDRQQEVVIKEEYSLSDKGRTLTLKTTLRGPAGDNSFKQVFVRQ